MLAWQIEAGADEAIAAAPVDRFALRAKERSIPRAETLVQNPAAKMGTAGSAQPSDPTAASPRAATVAPVVGDARQVAGSATSLEALREAFAGFEGCALKDTATNFVFADGPAKAPLMLIGEAPGAEEDRQGIPFVGPAGRLLNRMLEAIGLAREEVYITNIVPWRPPGNRNPTDSEIALCLPFIERHIALVEPRILVAVGGTAAKALVNTRDGIMRLRGRWFNYNVPDSGPELPLRAVLHPAYLLRQPGQKRDAWHDLIAIKKRLLEIETRS